MNEEIIKVRKIDSFTPYAVISTFLSLEQGYKAINGIATSAAQAVMDIAIGIENECLVANDGNWIAPFISEQFTEQFMTAISKHQAEGHLSLTWEKELKKFDQAYRKIRLALSYGDMPNAKRLSELKTCNACANYNTEMSGLKEKQDTQEKLAQAIATHEGISLEDARKKVQAKTASLVSDTTKPSVSEPSTTTPSSSECPAGQTETVASEHKLKAYPDEVMEVAELLLELYDLDPTKLQSVKQVVKSKINNALVSIANKVLAKNKVA